MIESTYDLNGQELDTITGSIFRAIQNSPISHEGVEAFIHHRMNAMRLMPPQQIEGFFIPSLHTLSR